MISSTDILHGKVLIVDDQQTNILLLERMLSTAGYVSVSSTLNPFQVREMHLENRYDLILLDLQMPGMDGFQVMEALKEVEPDGYLPVLVITSQPSHKLQALQAGAKDFISKPFELADVLARVHNMLEVRLLHRKLRSYNDALKQQVCEQTTLLAISRTLASTLLFQPNLILKQLQEIIAYSQGGIFALESPALVSLALWGTQTLEQSDPVHIILNNPEALEALFNVYQPIRIADVWSDDPQAQVLRSVLDADAAQLLEGIHSWMWIPLAVQGRLLGGVCLAKNTKNFFTEHHAELALSVANQSAITLSNAKLVGEEQALAVSEERQRLAHDLHDAVNQSLFSAGLIAEVLPRLWDMNHSDAERSLNELRLLIRGALAEMRALLTELRPTTLTNSKLSDLLRMLGNAFTGRTNVPVAFSLTGETSLPANVQVAFYRVCQETLNNIGRHANASHVKIDLWQDGTGIGMRIGDDGQGFDTAKIFLGHYGLGIMRERAGEAGAELSILSQPGQGTECRMLWSTIPLV